MNNAKTKNVRLAIDPILYRKVERLATDALMSVEAWLKVFFAAEVSTPNGRRVALPVRGKSFCPRGVYTRGKEVAE